jgi:co-chaperonin GroES (HSP10)
MSLPIRRIPDKYYPSEEENLKLAKRIEKYNAAFATQDEFMLKEIGTCVSIAEYGKFLVLVKSIVVPEKMKSGLLRASETIEETKKVYNVGLVIGIGPEAFRSTARFPFGPCCNVGDWISFTKYESQPEKFNRFDCRFVPDDKVNCPIPDIASAYPELSL